MAGSLVSLLAIFLIECQLISCWQGVLNLISVVDLSLAYVEHLEENCKPSVDEERIHEHYRDLLGSISSGGRNTIRRQSLNGSALSPLSEEPCPPSCKTNRHSIHNEPLSEHSALLRTPSSPTGTVRSDGHHHYSAADEISKCPYRNKYEYLRRKLHRHQQPSYSSHGRCESDLDGPPQDEVEDGLSTHLAHDNSVVGKKHAIVNTLVSFFKSSLLFVELNGGLLLLSGSSSRNYAAFFDHWSHAVNQEGTGI